MSQNEGSREKKKLFGGVLVLLPATLFTKVVGLFYKIPLIAIVGVGGMAYFLAAYHIYSLLFVLSATGLPTALSLAVARAVAEGRSGAVGRVLGVAMALFLSLGAVGTVILWLGAPFIAERLAMADAAAAIVAISPALLLSAFVGGAKGYFQGFHRMLPTALCEVLEASGKLFFGLGFALLAKGRGLSTPMVAAYAIFGITAGLAVAALLLLILLLWDVIRRRGDRLRSETLPPPRRHILCGLVRVALPVTVSASVMSVVTLIDTALISARLQSAGFAPSVANAMYSSYGNLAVPLYNLVPSLLTPITLSLMPLLGAAVSGGKKEGGRAALTAAMRLCLLVSVPSALGLGVFARPILSLIYHGETEAIAVAAPLLSLLAVSIVPAAVVSLLGAALQATGHTAIPVLAMGAGALVKLGAELLLLPVAGIHIYAAPISTLCCNLVVLLIEGIALGKILPFGFLSYRDLMRPFLSATVSILAGAALYLGLLRTGALGDLAMIPVLILTVLVFVLLSLRLGAVGREELSALPAGEKLCRALQKCKLLK